YSAFKSISDQHRFPADFDTPETAHSVASLLLSHPKFYGVIAEDNGHLLGSNFIDLRSSIVGLGPISVDPEAQNQGVGRQLMLAAMEEAQRRGCAGIRLVQIAYHNRSLCLYTTLGFRSRCPLSIMQGKPLHQRFPGYEVRRATRADADACNALCHRIHGFDRRQELDESVAQDSLIVVEHLGVISGYTNGLGFFTHTVADSNRSLMALIAAAPAFPGPGFFVPTTNFEVFNWCLQQGLRLVAQATYMTIGLFNEPDGAWLPSVLY
ncbi:MAG TPA: GNAT family N-acetyltransferase, partial [Acetobacteraceae bacterium]|nr:GNAT family N-acetyltransferase [Acetobacteraceae bacterium]